MRKWKLMLEFIPAILLLFMAYYLVLTVRASREATR